MQPGIYLGFAAFALTCSLQVAAAYLAVWIASRCTRSPKLRFASWSAFVFGSALYWFIGSLLRFAAPHSATSGVGGELATAHQVLLPNAWQQLCFWTIAMLGVLYAAGTAVAFGALIWRHVRLRWALRYATVVEPELGSLWSGLCASRGLHSCELLIFPGISSPATAFVWHPRVLLPESFAEMYPRESQMDVLLHELTHVRRRDYLWAVLADVAGCILWFHPALLSSRNKMRLERELACDEAVIAERPERRADYADALAAFARRELLSEVRPIAVDFAASAPLLTLRINSILEGPKRSLLVVRLMRLAGALAAVAGLIALSPALSIGLGISPALMANSLPASIVARPAVHLPSKGRHHPGRASASTVNPLAADETATAMAGTAFPPDPALSDSINSGTSQADVSSGQDSASTDPATPVWAGPPPQPQTHQSVARKIAVAVAGIIIRSDRERPGEHLASVQH